MECISPSHSPRYQVGMARLDITLLLSCTQLKLKDDYHKATGSNPRTSQTSEPSLAGLAGLATSASPAPGLAGCISGLATAILWRATWRHAAWAQRGDASEPRAFLNARGGGRRRWRASASWCGEKGSSKVHRGLSELEERKDIKLQKRIV